MVSLDQDEFTFARQPYELLGGDYTAGYLEEGDWKAALETVAKSYYFYWTYRPLFSPIIRDEHKGMFAREEQKFGYRKRESVDPHAADPLEQYRKRLVVPEPDRFYSHGSGKPLLATALSIPQLGLVQLVTRNGESLLEVQHRYNYHPVFILVRLVQLLAGLLTLLVVYRILARELDASRAVWGAAVFAFFPMTLKFFPNIHQDSVMVPFLVLAVDWYLRGKYVKCGLAFGLALAAKNAAIFLVPAFVVHAFYRSWQGASEAPGKNAGWRALGGEVRGLLLVGVVSFAVLLPFASPVSYAEEILTPVTGRAFDTRGEDVSHFFTAAALEVESTAGLSKLRPEIVALHHLVYLGEVAFFMVLLVTFGLLPRCTRDVSRLSLVIVLLSVPFGLVFSHVLDYRSLFFVPFFAIACADLLERRPLRILVFVLAGISLVYAVDPITTSRATHSADGRTFLQSLGSWIF